MDPRALESAIRRIPGVEAARVVPKGDNPIEIHVLAQPGKPAKQVVRDVQSLALAGFGISVDRRIISVVQIGGGTLGGDRPVIDDIAEQIDGSRTAIAVTLSWNGEALVGEATGPASPTTRPRLIAEATIKAVSQAFSTDAALAVAAVGLPTVGIRQVAVAEIVVVADGNERLLVGSALVGGDEARSIVRAVLDALNRQVPDLRR